jgi:CYTH domain-containing protein
MRKRLGRERRRGYTMARREALPAFRAVARKMERWLRQAKLQAASGDARAIEFGTFTAAVLRDGGAALARRLDAIASARDQASLHKARIRGKRLRYVLEPVADAQPLAHEALARLKALQNVLGDIHDRHVLLRVIRGDRRAPGKTRAALPDSAARALRAEATAELRQRFRELRRQWLEGGTENLLGRIQQLASNLESRPASSPPEGVEIERKFLLKHLPEEAHRAPASEIWQGWIPGQRLQERLRRVKRDGREELFRTVKLGRGIQRTEIEEPTEPALFARMWPLTEGRRVLKRRYVLEDGGRKWEIDEFLDRPLYLAEVELPAPDAEVSLPGWLEAAVEREVTGEDAFVNVNLAR